MEPSQISKVDLAIIGGGINGAGLACQAARAGLSVVLFEKGDFASGTSSKSTKLIHGGIRYLEQARFKLVFESLHERKRLMGMAPHLVHPVPFLLPSYRGDRRPSWMLKMGLWLYDFLAGTKNIARHQWFSPSQTLQKAPSLNAEGLRGCGLYYDAQVNDARLVLENLLAAEEAGAHCFNYCAVTRIERDAPGFRIYYGDGSTQGSGTLSASCLANTSGPWANQIARLLPEKAANLVRPTRGTHIVVPEIDPSYAVLITTPKDNRIIFVIPWRGFSLVGTTDLDHPGNPDQVHPTEEEIGYLLREASRVFPRAPWDRHRVIAAFAGLRPLAWSGAGSASSVSREDKIVRTGNLITIVGGKLTTYHSMAARALKMTFQILGRRPVHPRPDPLPGAPPQPWDSFLREETSRWTSAYPVSPAQATHLALLYGQRAVKILEGIRQEPRWGEPLAPPRPELLGQVAYAVQAEKARHLEDVLLRRLEVGYSPHRWGRAPEKASRLMGELLGWDEGTRQRELERYRRELYPAPETP